MYFLYQLWKMPPADDRRQREILLHYDDLDMRHQDLRQGQHAGPSLS